MCQCIFISYYKSTALVGDTDNVGSWGEGQCREHRKSLCTLCSEVLLLKKQSPLKKIDCKTGHVSGILCALYSADDMVGP